MGLGLGFRFGFGFWGWSWGWIAVGFGIRVGAGFGLRVVVGSRLVEHDDAEDRDASRQQPKAEHDEHPPGLVGPRRQPVLEEGRR